MIMKRTVCFVTLIVMTTAFSGCVQMNPGTSETAPKTQQTDTGSSVSDTKAQQTEITDTEETPADDAQEVLSIWTSSKTPVGLEYIRMWETRETAKTKDPEIISGIVDALKELSVGEETDIMTTDYTDILEFDFMGNEHERLEFEGDCWVTKDDRRYKVEGLEKVRILLERMMRDNTASEDEQETGNTDEEVVYKSTDDPHIDNGLFSIDIPEEFKGTYTGYYSDIEIYISDNLSSELMGGGGFVFGIEAVADPENYYDDHYVVLGQLESGEGDVYEVVITFPTDLQYAPAQADNYLALKDKAYDIAATIKSTDGGTYKPD